MDQIEDTTAGQGAETMTATEAQQGEQRWLADVDAQVAAPIVARAQDLMAQAVEHTPTREEAKAMFAENPGLWSVLTDEGTVTRDQC